MNPHAAGLVIAHRRGADWRLLVLRTQQLWDFPRSLIEADEDPLEVAKRDAAETTGLSDLAFDFGESHKDTLPYGSGELVRYFLAVTDTEHITLPIAHELGRPEQDEWRWIGFAEAEDFLAPRLAAVLDWARNTLDPD